MGMSSVIGVRTIKEVKVVKPGDEDYFPIVCGICGRRKDDEEYLRMYYDDYPNGFCVHTRCLLAACEAAAAMVKCCLAA